VNARIQFVKSIYTTVSTGSLYLWRDKVRRTAKAAGHRGYTEGVSGYHDRLRTPPPFGGLGWVGKEILGKRRGSRAKSAIWVAKMGKHKNTTWAKSDLLFDAVILARSAGTSAPGKVSAGAARPTKGFLDMHGAY